MFFKKEMSVSMSKTTWCSRTCHRGLRRQQKQERHDGGAGSPFLRVTLHAHTYKKREKRAKTEITRLNPIGVWSYAHWWNLLETRTTGCFILGNLVSSIDTEYRR